MACAKRINSTAHQFPGSICCWLLACVQAIWRHPGHGRACPFPSPCSKVSWPRRTLCRPALHPTLAIVLILNVSHFDPLDLTHLLCAHIIFKIKGTLS